MRNVNWSSSLWAVLLRAIRALIFPKKQRISGMNRVFSQAQHPVTSISFAAVAIKSISETQRHIGILYNSPSNPEATLLHLAWHHSLRNESPNSTYLWINPAIHPRRLRQVAAFCRKVWKSNGTRLPYAFSHPKGSLEGKTGRFLVGPTRYGLTCASFVLAVFEATGNHLLKYDTWPQLREGDEEWQREILGSLRAASEVTAAHLEAVENEVGAVRFRPEEVAGAAAASDLPADFHTAVAHSARILQLLSGV